MVIITIAEFVEDDDLWCSSKKKYKKLFQMCFLFSSDRLFSSNVDMLRFYTHVCKRERGL